MPIPAPPNISLLVRKKIIFFKEELILGRQLATFLTKIRGKKNSLVLQNIQEVQLRMEYSFYWEKNLSTDWTREVFLSWFSIIFFNRLENRLENTRLRLVVLKIVLRYSWCIIPPLSYRGKWKTDHLLLGILF